MAEKLIRGVSCPSCGGTLEIVEGTILLNCQFCSTGLMVKGDRGIQRFYVPIKRSKEEILPRIQKWFSKIDKASDLKTEATFKEVFPVYVPFWRVNATVMGWVLGDEKKGSGKNEKYEPVERRVNQRYEFTSPACDVGEFGVKWVDLQGDEILPFDLEEVQRQGMTFGVLTTPAEIVKSCEEKFLEWGEASARVDRKTFTKLHLIHRKLTIVYYPLWIVRYEYKKRMYQITADAESSELLYGRAPGNNLYRVACLVGSLMLGDFIITSALRSSDTDGIFAIIVVSLGIMLIGFRKFRYGGEIRIEQKDKMGGAAGRLKALVPKLKNVKDAQDLQSLLQKL